MDGKKKVTGMVRIMKGRREEWLLEREQIVREVRKEGE